MSRLEGPDVSVPLAVNPVLPGMHPDPTIVRVGDRFVMACSSFEYWPALPVFESYDLVNWRQIGNALDRQGQLEAVRPGGLDGVGPSHGLYAPTLRFHDGWYWLVCAVEPGGRPFVLSAREPEGPWSNPLPLDINGFDHDLAWDDDGTCVVTYSVGGRPGMKRATVDLGTGARLSEPVDTWNGTGSSPEAPHLYKIDGTWYLLIAEGGTERSHSVSIARSSSPYGPWEPCPTNPILTHRGFPWPIQNVGHGDLVQLDDGTWWMVVLGVRLKGFPPGWYTLGRETFLTRVRWDGEWPVGDDVTLEFEPPALAPRPFEDPVLATGTLPFEGISSDGFAPGWLSLWRRPVSEVSLGADGVVLHGDEFGLDGRCVFFGRRQQAHVGVFSAVVSPGSAQEAGLGVRLDDRHHCSVVVTGATVVARQRVGDMTWQSAPLAVAPGKAVELVVSFEEPVVEEGRLAYGSDLIRLGVRTGGDVAWLAALDGRYLSTEVAGGFTGRVVGAFATDGDAVLHSFTVHAAGA